MSTIGFSASSFKKKKIDKHELGYTDFGSETNRGGVEHMKVDNKTVR